MNSIAVGLVILITASCCVAQNYQQEVLNLHNLYRAKHHSPAMQLDGTMNANAIRCAQWLATQGKLDHNCPHKNGASDNLGWTSTRAESAAAREITNMWYNEVKKYDYNRPGFSSATGHFTQVVWKSSNKLGVGAYRDQSSGRTYVVALYSPRGNMQDAFQQNVLRP